MQTAEQLWKSVEKWIAENPTAYRAVENAASAITDAGGDVPMQFVMELIRYGNVFGEDMMHRLVRMLSGVEFADGGYAIPNAVVAGVSRVLKAHDGTLSIRTHPSKLDENGVPDALK